VVERSLNGLPFDEPPDRSDEVSSGRLWPVADQAHAARSNRLRDALKSSFGLVWRTLRGLGVDAASVDDAAQQVFLVLARRLSDVPAGKERAFLVSAAIRTAANSRRARQRIREAPAGGLDDHLSDLPDPEQLLQHKQRRVLLLRILDSMPDELRAVFVLFELEGLSSPEIAALLEIPRGTVVSRLRRARECFCARIDTLRNQFPDRARP